MIAPAKQFADFETLPAPQAGLNAIANLMEMAPTDALYIYNMICAQNGLQVRPGWQEWCTNMAGLGGVRTVISSRGVGTGGADFLFAVTPNGIYNCVTSSGAPTQVVTFGTQTGLAGYCEYDHFTNLAGDVCLLVCDEVNGYYTFDTATSTWLKVTLGAGGTQISGQDPATFASVRVFNNRVWFVQAGSGNAWYLPVGQIYGAVTLFQYGNRFPHGGNLNNLYIFTYGSYFGTFYYLVALGDAGDVLAYSGNDPSASASWTLSGQWYIGDLPAGRRNASGFGGDLLMLCAQGALPLSSMFFQKNVDDPTLYITAKIAPALAHDINQFGGVRGFQFVPWPSINSLIITEPIQAGMTKKQLCYNLATKGWSVFQNLDWQCAAFWHGVLYAGTSDGRLIKMSGNMDGQLLNGTGAVAITWGCLGSFQQGKSKGTWKLLDIIKPFLLSDGNVSYQVFARYDFNISDLMLGSVPFVSTPVAGGWDSGLWDSAIWSGTGSPTLSSNTQGASGGSGSHIAIGIIGASSGNVTHLGYNVSMRPTMGML